MKKSILFVDDEPNVIHGLRRMLHNMRHEWEMYFLGGGKEALSFLSKNHIDVLVTDMRMPDMDGATLLSEVMKIYPHIIRIILSGHSDQEMILRSAKSAHQFLVKPCNAETLKNTIERTLLLRSFLKNEKLQNTVTGLNDLPSSPILYTKIIKAIQSPSVSLKSIGDIIAKDITMTARVLQLVNSAFFGLPKKVVNPHHAVTLLGLDIIKSLVLCIELFTTFKKWHGLNKLYIPNLWNHSMMVGILAKKIAQDGSTDKSIIEEAFIGGILHDIGKLLLLKAIDLHQQIENTVMQQGISNLEAEYQILGTSHAEAGAYLLGLWGLPDNIIEAIAFHHRPTESSGGKFTTLTAVYIANALLKEDCTKDIDALKSIDFHYLSDLNLLKEFKVWIQYCNEMKAKGVAYE